MYTQKKSECACEWKGKFASKIPANQIYLRN